MRLVRVRYEGRDWYASPSDSGQTVQLRGADPSDLDGRELALDSVELLPVVAPSKIIGVGLNYRDHAIETGQPIPTSPVTFAAYPSALIADGRPIVVPTASTDFVDYEAELGVVIGRTAKNVRTEDALGHVLGYTCVNDVSARDQQVADGQWVRAKSFDTFKPVGPWLVTADELPNPQALAISCEVNGTTLQSSSTSEMIFSVAELISYLSRTATLLPGDLIMTGTPPGVGQARDPKVRLVGGDTVSVTIAGIGTLRNDVREV